MTQPKARVLLVDDDRLILATLGQGLRTAGYDVLEASGGKEALAVIEGDGVDLAILDVRMPEMSGIEVASWLREHSRVPFMFLSAYGEDEVVIQAVQEGALCYLVKPVDVNQLIPAIEAARGRAQEIRQLRETEQQLNTALSSSRRISVAVGLLMERHGLDEQQAFERLRGHARRERRKVAELAEDVVAAAQTLSLSTDGGEDGPSRTASSKR